MEVKEFPFLKIIVDYRGKLYFSKKVALKKYYFEVID